MRKPNKRSAARGTPAAKGGGAWSRWLFALSLAGMAISLYLWSAKAGAVELICGASGDCLTVNASVYSEIAGIPVAAAGTVMYAGLAALAVMAWRGKEQHALVGAFVLSFSGALFSLYLTGIEAFVLRAYCIWCLVSWVLISVIAAVWGWRLKVASDQEKRGEAGIAPKLRR